MAIAIPCRFRETRPRIRFPTRFPLASGTLLGRSCEPRDSRRDGIHVAGIKFRGDDVLTVLVDTGRGKMHNSFAGTSRNVAGDGTEKEQRERVRDLRTVGAHARQRCARKSTRPISARRRRHGGVLQRDGSDPNCAIEPGERTSREHRFYRHH